MLPLSTPVLATISVFTFLWAWNDFLGPLLFLTRKQTFTLALALQSYQTQHGGVQWHYLMAASAVTMGTRLRRLRRPHSATAMVPTNSIAATRLIGRRSSAR